VAVKKTLLGVLLMVLGGLWACAATSQSASSDTSIDQGDRELKRGVYWYQKGCMRKAMDHFHAAHEHYSLADQQTGVARSLNGLANAYRQRGNLENALLFYDAAVAAGRRCDDQTVLALALANKAAVLIDEEDLSAAEVLLDEAKLLARERGAVFALVLNYQAVLMMKAKQVDEAGALLDQADAVTMGDEPNIKATIRFTRGRLRMHADDYQQAQHLFTQALELDRQAGCSRCIADDLTAMADVHERLGEDEAALDCLERGLKIYALLENRPKVSEHLDRLERLADKTGGDLRVTVHFINQWIAGEAVDAICR
jgi:tetratricopeptide (TPR) repeat protein